MDLRQGDLIALAASVVEGYLTAPPPGVTVSFEAEIETAPARFDSKLLSRALRNLLENAVRASRDDGDVCVRVAREEGNLVIEVADRGPGVTAEDLERIFDPYFSTHDTGHGPGPADRATYRRRSRGLDRRCKSTRRGLGGSRDPAPVRVGRWELVPCRRHNTRVGAMSTVRKLVVRPFTGRVFRAGAVHDQRGFRFGLVLHRSRCWMVGLRAGS